MMMQIARRALITSTVLLLGAFAAPGLTQILLQTPTPVAISTPPPPNPQSRARVDFNADDRHTMQSQGSGTLVRIASVSKLVVALGVMRMVEAKQLNLDADASTYLGYTLRNPAFPNAKITVRHLLSHQSGLMDAGELYLIPIGDTVQNRMENPEMWDKDHAPGTYFRYANINFPVVASIMERASGERFDRLMQRIVLKPLGVGGCFGWASCTDDEIRRAVVLLGAAGNVRTDNLMGKRPECPVYRTEGTPCELTKYVPGTNGALFSPQGGLRISMDDLAKIGQMMLRNGRTADGQRFLKPASLAAMYRPAWLLSADGKNGVGEGEDGFFCAYGLAVQTLRAPGQSKNPMCKDTLFPGTAQRLGHAGEAYGLRSGLWIDPVAGTGVAFFATAVVDGEKGEYSAFSATEERMVKSPYNPMYFPERAKQRR